MEIQGTSISSQWCPFIGGAPNIGHKKDDGKEKFLSVHSSS